MRLKHYHTALIVPILLILLTSCGDNGTGSSIDFSPGTSFIGTYQVRPDPLNDPIIDTMYFTFSTSPTNSFSMRLLTASYLSSVDSIFLNGDTITDGVIELNGQTIIDNDRTYCDIRNVSYNFVTYTDSLIITVPSNYNYLETCNHDYNPGDTFRYYIQGNDIILIGRDASINRRIVLWGEVAIRIKN